MAYRKRKVATRRKRPVRYSKTKKMVTGHGPTLLDQMAAGAGQVGRLARAVLPAITAINTEAKYLDISALNQVAYNPGTNDYLVSLTQNLAQGLTDVTRIGNSILARNIALRIRMVPLFSTVAHFNYARIILFAWKENAQINAPTAAKLFEAPSIFHSPFNKDYTDQMVIIKDKIISSTAQISDATGQSPSFHKIFKPLEFHMRYDAAAGGTGTQNHIYLMIRGYHPTTANQIVFDHYSRLNFTDN